MAVTHREEVTVPQIQDVWIRQVGILVDFVGVVGRYSSLGGK